MMSLSLFCETSRSNLTASQSELQDSLDNYTWLTPHSQTPYLLSGTCQLLSLAPTPPNPCSWTSYKEQARKQCLSIISASTPCPRFLPLLHSVMECNLRVFFPMLLLVVVFLTATETLQQYKTTSMCNKAVFCVKLNIRKWILKTFCYLS